MHLYWCHLKAACKYVPFKGCLVERSRRWRGWPIYTCAIYRGPAIYIISSRRCACACRDPSHPRSNRTGAAAPLVHHCTGVRVRVEASSSNLVAFTGTSITHASPTLRYLYNPADDFYLRSLSWRKAAP